MQCRNLKWIAWTAFIATSLVSVYWAYFIDLFLTGREEILTGLAIVSMVLGVCAVSLTPNRLRGLLAGMTVLAIGQLWWIERTVTLTLLSFNGFAP